MEETSVLRTEGTLYFMKKNANANKTVNPYLTC